MTRLPGLGAVLAMALGASACGRSQTAPPVHAGPHGHGHGGGHGHARGQGDRVPHPERSAADYAAMLEEPGRAAWQMPERLVGALGITAGMRVADVGTGSGYFLPWLARAVGDAGRVVGEDIDPELLEIARARVARDNLACVELRRGTPDDPGLEAGGYDLVLLVDTYHHIVNRPVFLANIRRALARDGARRGRFVVVDFRDGPQPVGPPPEHKIPRAQVERELADAGFTLARSHDFLPYQFVLEFAARE